VFAFQNAEGAGFNSRGRKAVDLRSQDETEARSAGIPLHLDMGFTAAPAALDYVGFRLTTASRPWLFDNGPADLT
jgi:hypothetical protein